MARKWTTWDINAVSSDGRILTRCSVKFLKNDPHGSELCISHLFSNETGISLWTEWHRYQSHLVITMTWDKQAARCVCRTPSHKLMLLHFHSIYCPICQNDYLFMAHLLYPGPGCMGDKRKKVGALTLRHQEKFLAHLNYNGKYWGKLTFPDQLSVKIQCLSVAIVTLRMGKKGFLSRLYAFGSKPPSLWDLCAFIN